MERSLSDCASTNKIKLYISFLFRIYPSLSTGTHGHSPMLFLSRRTPHRSTWIPNSQRMPIRATLLMATLIGSTFHHPTSATWMGSPYACRDPSLHRRERRIYGPNSIRLHMQATAALSLFLQPPSKAHLSECRT